jgi:hypothetical protein
VTLCIRPQHVEVTPSATGVGGRIVRAAFREGRHEATVEIDWTGTRAHVDVLTRASAPLTRGDSVYLHVDPAHIAVVPPDRDAGASHH